MNKIKYLIFAVAMLLLVMAPFSPAQAQEENCPLGYIQDNGVCILPPPSGPSSTGVTFTNQPNPGACDTLTNGLGKLICKLNLLLNSIIPLLIALGVVYFVWGVVTYVIGDDEEAKKKGRDRIVFGIIGFVVIFGIWGLVAMVVKTFGLEGGSEVVTNFIASNRTAFGVTSACNFTAATSKISDLFRYITCIISSSVIPLLFALAVASFIWGVIQYVINGDDEAKKTKGRDFMLWGVIALAVMVSVWGLVSVLGNTFGFNTSFVPQVQPPQ